jgi:hypothetical protein
VTAAVHAATLLLLPPLLPVASIHTTSISVDIGQGLVWMGVEDCVQIPED